MNKQLIYGLLLSVVMVIAPHVIHLPLWVSALSACLLAWPAYLAARGEPLPSHWLLIAISIAATGGILIEYHSLFGREAGVTLLIVLSTLKLMELKTKRDAMALIYLCCFIIITNFLYSQSLVTGLYMLACLLIISQVWVQLHMYPGPFKTRLKIACTLLLQAIPLTVILFVLFPRLPGPLWGLPQDAFSRSGLDDMMSPGSLGRLALSDAVAFRVAYPGPPPRRDQMYWRGPVLWNFDGRTWTQGKSVQIFSAQLSDTTQPISYNVTLEADNKIWLFALDMPDSLSIPYRRMNDAQLLNPEPVTTRLRYQARSYLSYHANLLESAAQLQRALQLPAGFNPKSRRLAANWRANGSDSRIISSALGFFNRQNFHYTLDAPPLGLNGIDDFLFTTRAGFCEHYASGFVFLMRAAGIPARVVTGYQGGEYNAFGNYYIVRQSDAHAWAEVWLQDRGWLRIDPTAAIAPERVEQNLSAALPDNTVLPFMARNPPQWLRELSLNWDAISYQWNSFVIGYDNERQFAFMNRLGLASVRWQALSMMTGIALIIGLFALYMLRHLISLKQDKTQAAWLKFCRKLARSGLPRLPYEGPQAYAIRVCIARPDLAVSIKTIANRYIALRYGIPQPENTQRDFLQLVAQFRPSAN